MVSLCISEVAFTGVSDIGELLETLSHTLVQRVAEVHEGENGKNAQVELQDQSLLVLVGGKGGGLGQLSSAGRDILERRRLRRDLEVRFRAGVVCCRH